MEKKDKEPGNRSGKVFLIKSEEFGKFFEKTEATSNNSSTANNKYKHNSETFMDRYNASKEYVMSEGGTAFENAVKGSFNRFRSSFGGSVEDLAYMIKDYAPRYKPAETVLKNRTAGTIGEKADRQFELAKENAGDFGDKLIDAADSISETFGYSLLGPGALTYVLGTAEGLEEYRKQRESGIPQKVAFNRALAKTSAAVLLDKIGDYVAKNNRIDEKLYGKSKSEANTYGLQYGKNNIADDIYYPKTRREESAFNRSLANKTSELKEGEIKRIIIDTADNTYFIEANGYMSGEIKLVIPIDENTEWLRDHRRGFLDGNYEPREEDIIFIKSRGR